MCLFTVGHNTAFKIQADRSLWQFLRNIIKGYVAEFIFLKIPWFQHNPLNTFRRMHLWNYGITLWDASHFRHTNNIHIAKASLQKLIMEVGIKMEAASPIHVTKKFWVVSESDVHNDFDFARPLFYLLDRTRK